MAVNVLNFNQVSTLLAAIVSQATGNIIAAPVNTAEFVTVGQTALLTGTDNVINAISQVLSRTIFSIRPYNAKFKGMRVTAEQFGRITRKLVSIDNPFEDDDRFELVDGESVDMYVVKKPTVLQLNFYGFNVYQQSVTIFRDQLNVAFEGPAQFGEFITMVMQNISDQLEQADEELSRQCINNMIGGVIASGGPNAINVIEAYIDDTGDNTINSDNYKSPEIFPAFAKWLYGFINSISDKLELRSAEFHTNLGIRGQDNFTPIMRHTPKSEQRIYMISDIMNRIKATVLADTFNEFLLSIGDYETIPFWQSMRIPTLSSTTPIYLDTDGELTAVSQPVTANVLGVIADVEAFGVVNMNEWMSATPFNARGGYYNMFWHQEKKYWNDFTENCVVLYIPLPGGGGGGDIDT